MSHNSLHNDWWSTTGPSDKNTSITSGNGDLTAQLKQNNITVNVSKMDKTINSDHIIFKLVLMKLPELSDTEYKLGDIDEDGEITQADWAFVQRYIQGGEALTDKQLKAADVNKDGEIDTGDTYLIAQYINGKITDF